MPMKFHIAKLLDIINVGSMPMYLPHMNSMASTMWQGEIYTDQNDANTDDRTDSKTSNNEDNAAWLH